MSWGIVPQQSVYIALLTHQIVNHAGSILMFNTIHLEGPVGSHISQPDPTVDYRVSNKTGYFQTIILLQGKTVKPFFLFPAIQERLEIISSHLLFVLRLVCRNVVMYKALCMYYELHCYCITKLLVAP